MNLDTQTIVVLIAFIAVVALLIKKRRKKDKDGPKYDWYGIRYEGGTKAQQKLAKDAFSYIKKHNPDLRSDIDKYIRLIRFNKHRHPQVSDAVMTSMGKLIEVWLPVAMLSKDTRIWAAWLVHEYLHSKGRSHDTMEAELKQLYKSLGFPSHW